MDLLILAAGKGSRVYGKIKINKSLLKVKNKTLLENIVFNAKSFNFVKKINIVVGFKKQNIIDKIKNKNISFKDFNTKEMLHSLLIGLKKCKNDTLVSYSDIYFSKNIIKSIYSKAKNEIIIPVNKNWKKVWRIRGKSILKDCETLKYDKRKNLTEIGNKIKFLKNVMGQYMGIIYIPKDKIKLIKKLIIKNKKNSKLHISQFLNKVIKENVQIKCLPTKDYWYEFDDLNDLKNFSKKIY